MVLEDVEAALHDEPFVPLRLHKTDGTTLRIPYRHVATVLDYGVVVFKGVRGERSRVADGYEVVGFDRIDRIDRIKSRRGRRASGPRKKAS